MSQNQVAETCFELLHIEIVDYFKRQCFIPPLTQNRQKEEKGERKVNIKKLHAKLLAIGQHVGQRLAERLTKEQPRFVEPLEIIKFICKDFWIAVFRKQVDKLQTNYKGIYVLHDFNFRWLARISAVGNVVEEAKPYTFFACGVIRGALSNLGLNTTVKAEITKPPNCQFTIIDLAQTKKDDLKQKKGTLSSLPSLSNLKSNPTPLSTPATTISTSTPTHTTGHTGNPASGGPPATVT